MVNRIGVDEFGIGIEVFSHIRRRCTALAETHQNSESYPNPICQHLLRKPRRDPPRNQGKQNRHDD